MLAPSRTAYLKKMATFTKFVVCNLSKSLLVVAIFIYLWVFHPPSQEFFLEVIRAPLTFKGKALGTSLWVFITILVPLYLRRLLF